MRVGQHMFPGLHSTYRIWTQAPYRYAFWSVYCLTFILESRTLLRARGNATGKHQDGGNLWALIGLMFISVALAFWFADNFAFAYIGWYPRYWFEAGLALMLSGAALRQLAITALGRQFTGRLAVPPPQHGFIQNGIYRFIRHPAYTGSFLIWLGLGFALTNALSIAILFGMAAFAYGLRIHVEENALRDAFGVPYRAYCQKTKRFIPWLF